MAGTTGALKSLIEGAGLGVMVVRDRLPKNVRYPALILSDSVNTVMEHHGDFGSTSASYAVIEMVTIDLYQAWRTMNGQVGESMTLADDLLKLLHGASLPTHSKRVYGVQVTSMVRLAQIDLQNSSRLIDNADSANVVHHSYSVLLRRAL